MAIYTGASSPYQKAVNGVFGANIDTSSSQGSTTTVTPELNAFTGKSDAFKGITGLGLQKRDDGSGLLSAYVPGYGQSAGIAHNPVAGVYGLFSQNVTGEELKQGISGNDPQLSGGARALSIGHNAALTSGLSLIGFL